MQCIKCNSPRILSASAKCSDLFSGSIGNVEYLGYVPDDLGIGNGDYIEIDLCLDCGQMQGTWPLPLSSKERKAAAKGIVTKPPSKEAKAIYDLAYSSDADTSIVLEALCNLNNVDLIAEAFSLMKNDLTLKSFTLTLLWHLESWDHYKELCLKMNVDPEYPEENADDYEDED